MNGKLLEIVQAAADVTPRRGPVEHAKNGGAVINATEPSVSFLTLSWRLLEEGPCR